MIILLANSCIHASNFIPFIAITFPFDAMDDLGNYRGPPLFSNLS
jgi:hypothetical protein